MIVFRNTLPKVLMAALCVGLMGVPAASASAPTCSTSPADAQQVVKTVQSLFAAMGAADPDRFHAVTTSGFYAFDNGKRFSADELMNVSRQIHAAGKAYVWTVTEPDVHVTCNTAWITYVNRGSISDQSGKQELTWLESAQLTRERGHWRIQFLESERAGK
jgi:hypothetical protein